MWFANPQIFSRLIRVGVGVWFTRMWGPNLVTLLSNSSKFHDFLNCSGSNWYQTHKFCNSNNSRLQQPSVHRHHPQPHRRVISIPIIFSSEKKEKNYQWRKKNIEEKKEVKENSMFTIIVSSNRNNSSHQLHLQHHQHPASSLTSRSAPVVNKQSMPLDPPQSSRIHVIIFSEQPCRRNPPYSRHHHRHQPSAQPSIRHH